MFSLFLSNNIFIILKTLYLMQPNPTAPKSNDAGENASSKRKTKTSKPKIKKDPPDLSGKVLDKQDVLQLMHISESTLQKWRKKGLLSFSRVMGKIYYKESDILQL